MFLYSGVKWETYRHLGLFRIIFIVYNQILYLSVIFALYYTKLELTKISYGKHSLGESFYAFSLLHCQQ